MTSRKSKAVIMIAVAVVVIACVVWVDGTGRNAFVGDASILFRGATYTVVPHIFCMIVAVTAFSVALMAQRLFRR